MHNPLPPLVGADDLAVRLRSAGPAVIDLRPADEFRSGHIRGAVRSDYAVDGWRTARGGVPGYLPDPEKLSALLGSLGLRPGRPAVIVPPGLSPGDFSIAARVYWTLRSAGHGTVSILDGGMADWSGAGHPVEAGPEQPRVPDAYPVQSNPALRAELPDVAAAVADRSATLVDSRGPKSFRGEEKSAQAARAGRLPGAINLEGAGAFDAGRGRLRPRAELETLFGPVPPGPAVAFCNTGQAAATNWFVLSEILGRPGIRLYDGSMSEWTADPARPVETG